MERVPVARYSDTGVALLAARLLSEQGFDAVFLDQSGKATRVGTVLVAWSEAEVAHAVLRQAECSREPASGIAEEFRIAMQGVPGGGIKAGWTEHLPFVVIGAALVLMLAIGVLFAVF